MTGERILVVDDDPAIVEVVVFGLRLDGFEVMTAANGVEALALAADLTPDLVILDIAMPEIDGVEVCRRLRANPRTSHLPVVMLTARSLSSQIIDGLGVGADDYVTKPFDPEVLSARIQTVLRRSTELRAASPLTGLPGNRRIEQELAKRVGRPAALGYADLNDFKAYNDHYGFLEGDRMLQATAWLLREVLAAKGGDGCFLGHVGGDDFLLVCDPSTIRLVCEMATSRFDALAPTLYRPEDAQRGYLEGVSRRGEARRYPLISLSIGVATTGERALTDHRALIDSATVMKQQVKQSRSGASDFAIVDLAANA